MKSRANPKGRFAYQIVNKHGVFTLMIGLTGQMEYIPLSQCAYAPRMPIDRFQFQSEAEAQLALAKARAWLEFTNCCPPKPSSTP